MSSPPAPSSPTKPAAAAESPASPAAAPPTIVEPSADINKPSAPAPKDAPTDADADTSPPPLPEHPSLPSPLASNPAPTAPDPAALKTPAPPRSITPLIPNAPAHPPPAKGLPARTPAGNATPSVTSGFGAAGEGVDLAEFDPYATPAPAPTASAAEVKDGGGKGKEKAPGRVTVVSADVREGPGGVAMSPTASGSGSAGGSARASLEGGRPRAGTPGTPARVAGGEGGNGGEGGDGEEKEDKEPAFNFSGFLKDLKMKSAEPVARYLKSFLNNFAKKPFTVNEQIKLIHDFLAFISEKMAQVEPWKSQSSAEFDNALEAMEKLVMNRLYNYTFTPQLVPSQPITTDDLERDAVFSQRVRLFGWVRERHLDVPEGEASQGFLGFAEQELLKINHYKAPRDKMICILNCCKVIFGLIRNTYGAEAGGADAFVPILIFVVLRANPENMISNLEYISRFRSADKLQGEAGYYLSSLTGSIQFIETMDASSLSNITQPEFEALVESAIQSLPPSPSSTRRQLPGAPGAPRTPARSDREREREMSPFAAASPGEEPARALTMSAQQQGLEGTRRWFAKTGQGVQEAVSRPLSAIGKILEGMGPAPGSAERTRSEDGSEDEGQGGGRGGAGGSGRTPRDVFGAMRFRAGTPESPSRGYSHLGVEEGGISRAGTPSSDILPDFSALQLQSTLDASQETFTQTRRANVLTLHQMFPALDEEIVEAVLEGSGDDLGAAIDRLLEM
ncbi:hypothetical protein IAT38_002165 [Cryptococcus sp. DSM 104549]